MNLGLYDELKLVFPDISPIYRPLLLEVLKIRIG